MHGLIGFLEKSTQISALKALRPLTDKDEKTVISRLGRVLREGKHSNTLQLERKQGPFRRAVLKYLSKFYFI